MKTKTSILTVSIAAIMAVSAANAEIASTTYVDGKITPVETKINNHVANTGIHVTAAEKSTWSGKQDALGFTPENTANKLAAEGDTYDADKVTNAYYPTAKTVDLMINLKQASVNGDITSLKNNKQNKIPAAPQNGAAGDVVTFSGTSGTFGSVGFDNAPTANSTNLVKSGAIKTAVDTAEQNAKAYADGLAGNYATAAQGTKADNAVPNTRKVNGKALNADISLTAADVGADASGAAAAAQTAAVASAKSYTDTEVAKKVTANDAITGATHTKITYDSKGLVTAGADLTAADIPDLATNKVTKLTGYSKGTSAAALATGDTLNAALGKLENKADNAAAAAEAAAGAAADAAAAQVNADWDATSGKAQILNKPTLATVATSGSYNDLSNKPTIDTALSADSTNAVQNKVVNTALAGKVPTSRTVNGKALSSNITLSASDVGADASGAAAAAQTAAVASAKSYTDTEVAKKVTANDAITGATHTKITYDSKGLVTAGADLTAADIPNLATNKVTTLTGYSKGTSAAALATGDTLNAALGKLENKADNAAAAASSAADAAAAAAAAQVNADWNATSGKAQILNKPTLATVATSGSYNDLSNKPTIDTALSADSTNAVQNKVVNTALGTKQDTISDLATIRSNATAGQGAATTIATYGNIVTHNVNEFQASGNYITVPVGTGTGKQVLTYDGDTGEYYWEAIGR